MISTLVQMLTDARVFLHFSFQESNLALQAFDGGVENFCLGGPTGGSEGLHYDQFEDKSISRYVSLSDRSDGGTGYAGTLVRV